MNTFRTRFALMLTVAALPGCATPPAPLPAPDIATMALAQRSSEKIGVPADVRYRFSGAIAPGRPVSLQIAVIPRIEGRNLGIELPQTAGIALGKSPTRAALGKATATDVLRFAIELTPSAGAPDRLPLIVSMDVDGGHFFSVFSIPLGTAAAGPSIQ